MQVDNVNNPHGRAFTSHIPEEKTGDYALTDQASAGQPITAAAIENNQAFLDSSPPRDTNNLIPLSGPTSAAAGHNVQTNEHPAATSSEAYTYSDERATS